MRHASCLTLQGVWTHWLDYVHPFDLSWKNLIMSAPSLISFVLNAQINSVKTPDMLKLWGFIEYAHCPLCRVEQCTLSHILSSCEHALTQKRYTWRHDSVLANIEISLRALVDGFNSSAPVSFAKVTQKSFKACFVRKGEKKAARKKKEDVSRSLLESANDWRLLVDFDHKKVVFPPTIVPTSLRPDIVLWSNMSRVVIIIELTCPAEENMKKAQLKKEGKYADLVNEINETKVWKASLRTLEVGARGLLGISSRKLFIDLGFTSTQARKLCKKLSLVVARCSYAIYQAHNNLAWSHNNDLIVVDGLPLSRRRDAEVEPTNETNAEETPGLVSARLPDSNGGGSR